jgi:cell division protease FtsH
MRRILHSTLVVSAILVSIVLLASFALSTSTPISEISLSELAKKINAGSIATIEVRQDIVAATATDGARFSTRKETSISLIETLDRSGVDQAKLNEVAITVKNPEGFGSFMGALLPLLIPALLVMGIFWYMMRQAQRGSTQAMTFGKSKAKLASAQDGKKKVTFKDVAGLLEAKTEVTEVVEFLKDPARFHRLGARIPRGILLVGSPGTGKTLLAKAEANEANVPFFYVSGSEFIEMFVGVGANRVRDTFETAKQSSPSIIFVDEVDAIGRVRGAGVGGGHDEREQTLNQILVEMDGFDTDTAVIVMAATNRPDILDPALLRPGRFDRRIILDEPSLSDRIEALGIHTASKPMMEGVNLRVVAERTVGFSGADLANLVNEAAILAARNDQTSISQDNLLEAIEKVTLGPERRSHVLSPREKAITAHHEAGHALLAAITPHSDPVHKVSIVSRGRAGGYTMKLPSEDKYMKTKTEFEAELTVLLGGHTAEEIIYGEVTTGASNDLKVASDLARRMVTQYGMSEKLGPMSYGDNQEAVFLGREMIHERNYSEQVAQQIDQEVRALVDQAKVRALATIQENLSTLKAIASALIERETLEQADFYTLIGKPIPTQVS